MEKPSQASDFEVAISKQVSKMSGYVNALRDATAQHGRGLMMILMI